jgi:hypothetical protein
VNKSTDTESKLLATLKRHAPHVVRVYHGDDHRDVAVPTRRRKWSQVIEAIEGRAWTSCELRDKAGAVLGYVENDSAASGLEELGEDYGGTAGELRLAERIVNIAMRAAREAVASRDRETTQLLAAQGSVVAEMQAGMRAIVEVYREQMVAKQEVAEANTEAAVAAATASQGQLKELMEALPVLVQALPMLKGLLSSGGGGVPSSAK